MLAVQCAVSFAVWLGYGFWLWRRRERLRQSVDAMSRTKRAIGGAGLLVLGAVWLFGGMLALQALHGIREGALTWWAWPAMTVIGLGFVHAQAQAVAMMISVALEGDTPRPRESSMMQKTEDIEP